MLSSPHKRFVWARPQRFSDFSDLSFFRAMVEHRRDRRQERDFVKEPRPSDKRWKPAPWTPWLWVK
jgi:hypothetical protein